VVVVVVALELVVMEVEQVKAVFSNK